MPPSGNDKPANDKRHFDRPETDDFSSPHERARLSFLRPPRGRLSSLLGSGLLLTRPFTKAGFARSQLFCAPARTTKSDHAAEGSFALPSAVRSKLIELRALLFPPSLPPPPLSFPKSRGCRGDRKETERERESSYHLAVTGSSKRRSTRAGSTRDGGPRKDSRASAAACASGADLTADRSPSDPPLAFI